MDVINIIKRQSALYKHVYLFGAGFRAKILVGILLSELKSFRFEYAVVTNKKNAVIDLYWDISVIGLGDVHSCNSESLFVIGMREAYAYDVISEIQAAGFTNYIFISDKNFEIMKRNYVKKRYADNFRTDRGYRQCDYHCGEIECKVKIYMVKSEMDKKIKHDIQRPDIIPIQGGRQISSVKIAELGDDTGQNISLKNRRLNEFTVLFWMWKNAPQCADYIGLCHYRRIFDMDSALDSIKNEHPDVILGEMELLFPTLEKHYNSVHYQEDFVLMKNVLRKHFPEYYKVAEDYFSQELFVPYNMVIAKRAVFNEYAEWIFSVLEEIERLWTPHGNEYQDRAIAFLGERLMGVYFLYHRNRLKIVYSKIMLLE